MPNFPTLLAERHSLRITRVTYATRKKDDAEVVICRVDIDVGNPDASPRCGAPIPRGGEVQVRGAELRATCSWRDGQVEGVLTFTATHDATKAVFTFEIDGANARGAGEDAAANVGDTVAFEFRSQQAEMFEGVE